MNSIILRTALSLFVPLAILFSIFLLFSGHNAPGGGFAGGLVAGAAVALTALVSGPKSARRLLRVEPVSFMGAGLALALASGLPALLLGRPYLTGLWFKADIPGLGPVAAGTPLLFDAGVFLLVLGVAATVVLCLVEEES